MEDEVGVGSPANSGALGGVNIELHGSASGKRRAASNSPPHQKMVLSSVSIRPRWWANHAELLWVTRWPVTFSTCTACGSDHSLWGMHTFPCCTALFLLGDNQNGPRFKILLDTMPTHSPIIGSCKSYHSNTNGTCKDRGVSKSTQRERKCSLKHF